MEISQIAGIVIMVLFALALLKARRKRSGGATFGSPGPGAAGAIYDMLNEDKRSKSSSRKKPRRATRKPPTAICPSSNHRGVSSVRLHSE